ncbi:ATP-grasp fold amidoligase family protein [Escherichia coli]|uniref:ATP-grasp fold amidoligase family protein n=1 Tax=Escherichia coli TaxID=562 RepID=UPI003BB965EA
MPSLQYKLFSQMLMMFKLEKRLRILYFRRFHQYLNLDSPKTFNEKIQYRKIYCRDSLLTLAAGKLESKCLVAEICGTDIYLPKDLWEGETAESIDGLAMESLPENYVFKANHTSQTLKFITNGNHLPKSKMKELTYKWLKHDQGRVLGEWAYINVSRKVFIEEYLDFGGKVPDDYKFFVFHGKVYFIQLDTGRFTNHKRNMFDREWNDLGFDYSHPRINPPPVKPYFLSEMIAQAEKIGQLFDFIRVDFYFYNDRVTFGELTVYPGAGFEKFPDQKYDILFGSHWHLKCENKK